MVTKFFFFFFFWVGADVGCQGSPSIDITWIRTTVVSPNKELTHKLRPHQIGNSVAHRIISQGIIMCAIIILIVNDIWMQN